MDQIFLHAIMGRACTLSGLRQQRSRKGALLAQPDTMLIVGTDKTKIIEKLPRSFLLIDDGSMIDALDLPPRQKITKFDYRIHTFNPLKNLAYKGARDFVSMLDAVFPEGENTLTRKNSNFILLKALLDSPVALDKLLIASKEPAQQDAYQKIQTLLLSPILKKVLLRAANFSFKGTLLVRLDRAELGDFDCFVLGNLLIGQYQGHVVVPDYGFYAAPFHTKLIQEKRLIAGVNYLDELPQILRNLLLLGEVTASYCIPDDAETLALYSRFARGSKGFNDFVKTAIGS